MIMNIINRKKLNSAKKYRIGEIMVQISKVFVKKSLFLLFTLNMIVFSSITALSGAYYNPQLRLKGNYDYLGADGIITQSSAVKNWVTNNLDVDMSDSIFVRARAIQTQLKALWDHDSGVLRVEIPGSPDPQRDLPKTILSDEEILTYIPNTNDDTPFNFVCWNAAPFLCSVFRICGIKSRMLYFDCATSHFSTEFWDGYDWIPADCDNAYGWFGKDSEAIGKLSNGWWKSDRSLIPMLLLQLIKAAHS